MALSDVFLTPLGLLALLSVVPIVVLYLVQPDPRRVELPTLQFLLDDDERDASNPLLERLKRNLLLLLQLLVLVALAVALAGPYVSVSESQTVEETVIVLDGSASMGVETDGGTRFTAAVAAAREETTGTNAVVFAGAESRIALRSGGDTEVQATLDELAVTDTTADLGAAISQAASIAGENARVVVFSDFADDAGWADAVRSARARDLQVDLRQFAGGGDGNVGIVDRSFSGRNVTVAVKNFGESTVTRSVSLGGRSRSLELGPGGVERVSLVVPAGGGQVRLTPGDAFPTDDTAYVAAPSDPTVDVLLLTNDPNRYLTTALSVVEEVELTVDEPPTTVADGYDVILYSNLEPESLLRGNVEAGRDVIEAGGGVGVLAQPSPPETYGDLLLLAPNGTGTNPSVGRVATTELTRGIDFPPPGTYLQGSLRSGTAVVGTAGGTPLIATETRGPGRVLYYGYVTNDDPFRFNYQYPVFWKRAVFHLAGRESLSALNREAGSRLRFANETRVETPDGAVSARVVPLDAVGFYAVGDRRIGVSLYSEAESDVDAVALDERASETGVTSREEERQVPRPLTWLVGLAALLVALGEVAFLRRRGDL
ncbi:vWA domain-containing protein [Haloplanus halophilus]|uniref:vWA domain-containing protein n=1 Tax=Haloplanus halophilus TaxID=2949993 RepID=UPI00203C4AD5|nr:VWA domain-containing protein [Haloplanus sp. GDY1]